MTSKISATLNVITFEPDKHMRFGISLENNGATTALNFTVEARLVRFEVQPPNNWKTQTVEQPSVGVAPPRIPVNMFLIAPDAASPIEFQRIYSGRRQVRVWAWGHYDDEFGGRNHSFLFCWAYDHDGNRMTNCTQQQYSEYQRK
jgi:hypothetical protein